MPRYIALLSRWLVAFLLCWFAWLASPNPVRPRPAMSNRIRVQQILCVSHGCVMWGETRMGEGRNLAAPDIRAIQIGHALLHNNKTITPADLFGDQENE